MSSIDLKTKLAKNSAFSEDDDAVVDALVIPPPPPTLLGVTETLLVCSCFSLLDLKICVYASVVIEGVM